MNKIILTIKINRLLSEVFAFILNPKNTPKYVDSIITEETNEWPVKEGSIYRNKRKNLEWSEYEVVKFKKNEIFELRKKNDGTIVRYTFKPIGNNMTELEYYVQTKEEVLDETSIRNIVEKLKIVLEK